MVVKNTKTKNKEFNYDKNEATIQMFSYLGAGVRIRKTKKMVEVQHTVFHNKDSSMTKMRIKTHNPVKMRIKTHNPVKMRIKPHNPMKMRIKTHNPVEMKIKAHNPMEMRIKTHNPMEKKIKTYILMKMVKYNLNKGFKLGKVEKNKNGVCREQSLVDN